MVFFFFKQKTAYEMRISDWSSDVCSSDLRAAGQDVALVDLAVRDAAVVHHMNLALQLANLAGATETELTGRRNVEAARPGNLENRVGFLALRLDARQ